jgi:hypothetical protein
MFSLHVVQLPNIEKCPQNLEAKLFSDILDFLRPVRYLLSCSLSHSLSQRIEVKGNISIHVFSTLSTLSLSLFLSLFHTHTLAEREREKERKVNTLCGCFQESTRRATTA